MGKLLSLFEQYMKKDKNAAKQIYNKMGPDEKQKAGIIAQASERKTQGLKNQRDQTSPKIMRDADKKAQDDAAIKRKGYRV